MNENYEGVVKQESIGVDQEFISVVPPSNECNTAFKNEPIFDDQSPIIVIKNEPITDDTLVPATNPITASNVKPVTQFEHPTVNGFIIYELDPKSYENNCNRTPTVSNNYAQRPRSASSSPILSRTVPLSQQYVTATKSASPPILLNGQLRKRSKAVGPTSSQNSIAHKKRCYNLQNTNVQIKTINNAGTKKIINYQMLKKRPFIPDNDLQHTLKCRPDTGHLQELPENRTLLPESETTESEKDTEMIIKTEILEDNAQHGVVSATENIHVRTAAIENSNAITVHSPAYSGTPTSSTRPSTCNSEVQTETQTIPNPCSELKVKCLCRLTQNDIEPDSTSSSNAELVKIFKNMFQQTRRLTKQQQRTVKMSLLQAICESEEMVEKGKCCCF